MSFSSPAKATLDRRPGIAPRPRSDSPAPSRGGRGRTR
jgi:hypothetical protein